MRQSDTARTNYLKRVTGGDEESPTDYDVVINTERLTPDTAVGLILGLVQGARRLLRRQRHLCASGG